MIGMCQKCGFMGDPPSQGPTEEEWGEMQTLYRDTLRQLEHSQLAEHDLGKRLFARDQAFYEMESKLNNMLEILMAQTDAKRLSVISKIKKKLVGSDVLTSIRRANANGES